jgi:NTE family protein
LPASGENQPVARKITRGLLLSGGGARAAYQAGVLRHIEEIARELGGKQEDPRIPFEILVGTSAGALNAAALASRASSFRDAVDLMVNNWHDVSTDKVFHSSAWRLVRNGMRWLLDLTLGGAENRREPRGRALVDADPLAHLVERLLPAGAIESHIQAGILDAVAITATDYDSGALTIFVQGRKDRTLWRRYSRVARYDEILPAHILASCALPILFPAVRIGNSYFGDGSIRNTAPLSPAIHLGARKVLAIGGREQVSLPADLVVKGDEARYPALAKISGVLLDSIFLDALESDREQMMRINKLLEQLPDDATDDRGVRMRPIDFLYLGPSQDLAALALKHRHEMPRTIRYMLRGLGASGKTGGDLLSYLLFEAGYCRELLDLGYQDARARTSEIQRFLWAG